MSGYGFQDSAQQSTGFQWPLIWNRHMVRSADGSRQTDVGAGLVHRLVTENPHSTNEDGGVNIAGDFQTASASSRTKCNRMIFGIGPGAPSPK